MTENLIAVNLGVAICKIKPFPYDTGERHPLLHTPIPGPPHMYKHMSKIFLNVPETIGESSGKINFCQRSIDEIVADQDSYSEYPIGSGFNFGRENCRVVGVYEHGKDTFPIVFSPFMKEGKRITFSVIKPYQRVGIWEHFDQGYSGLAIPIDRLPGHFYIIGPEVLTPDLISSFIAEELRFLPKK